MTQHTRGYLAGPGVADNIAVTDAIASAKQANDPTQLRPTQHSLGWPVPIVASADADADNNRSSSQAIQLSCAWGQAILLRATANPTWSAGQNHRIAI
jgi:hypothetical protein